MYEFKESDVFDFANFIGAETKEKGNELFFKYCPKCNGGGKDTETFSMKMVLLSVSDLPAIIMGILLSWQGTLNSGLKTNGKNLIGNCHSLKLKQNQKRLNIFYLAAFPKKSREDTK